MTRQPRLRPDGRRTAACRGPARWRVVAALLGTLAGGAMAAGPLPSLHAELLGLWCNSEDGGRSCWAWDEFRPDGSLHLCGRHAFDREGFSATATVHFSGSRMCYQVLEATPTFWLRAGQRYCTEIVSVAPDAHVYRDLDSGQQFTLLRRPVSDKGCS